MLSLSKARDQTYELTAAQLEALDKIKTVIGPSGYITELDEQQYSVRFRDDAIIRKLYSKEENKPEAFNMNRLFQTPM